MTLNDRLEAFFRARPNVYVDGKLLARHFGGYGWRSRVSDVRRQRGLTIENKQRRVTKRNGGFYTVSWYRFVPWQATEPRTSGEVQEAPSSVSSEDQRADPRSESEDVTVRVEADGQGTWL